MARFLYFAAVIPLSATAVRPLGGLTLSDWLFFASLCALIVGLPSRRNRTLPGLPPLLLYGVAIFAVGGVASSFNTIYQGESLAVLARFVYLTVVWFWLGVMLLSTLRHVVVVVTLWVVSAAVAAAAAAAQVLWGYGILPAGLAGPDFSFTGRMAGMTLHPNDLGSMEAFALVPCLALLTRGSETWTLRILYLAVLTFILGGLLISGSVGALLSALVAFVVWVVVFSAARRQFVLIGSISAAVIFAIFAAPSLPFPSPLQRISQVTANTSTASLSSRIALDSATVDIMIQEPLIGVGLDTASQMRFVSIPPEDMFLLAWLGGGLLGLAGLVVIVVSCLRDGLRKLRSGNARTFPGLYVALYASFLSTLVFALASPILQQRYAWMSAAILLAIRSEPRMNKAAERFGSNVMVVAPPADVNAPLGQVRR